MLQRLVCCGVEFGEELFEQMPALVGSPLAISLVLHKPPSAYFVCGASPVRHVCVEGGGICLRAKKRWQRREPKSSSRRSSSSSSSRSVVGMVRCSSGLQQQFPVPVVSGFGAPLPRLQDLDPSTMLLQQRILFLGSQVREFYPSFPSFSSLSLLLLFFLLFLYLQKRRIRGSVVAFLLAFFLFIKSARVS